MMESSNKGFTLLELMLAVAILLIALGGFLFAYITCIALSLTAKNTTVALSGANAKIEEIKNSQFDILVANYSPGGTPGNSFLINNWLNAIDQRGTVEIVAANSSLTLYEVRVTVSWREKGGRILGEDKDLDSVLDSGEDTNGNNQLDSPVKIVTLISRRP